MTILHGRNGRKFFRSGKGFSRSSNSGFIRVVEGLKISKMVFGQILHSHLLMSLVSERWLPKVFSAKSGTKSGKLA
jgi:hypothetical protein